MRIAVTGSSGKLGRATVARLRADGHEVLGVDQQGEPGPGFTRVDLGDYGQTLDALLGVTARHTGLDAVVHLAAVPVNGLMPDAATFRQNIHASFDVLFAAHRAGIRTVVFASSITAMGFPFEVAPPALPVDESYTAAFNTYGLGKVAEEAIARQLAGWDDRLSITGLRFTNVVAEGEYGTFARAGDPDYRRDLIGSYVDARDGARAVALALEHARAGYEVYNVAAPDTGLDIPSAELAARWFPGVPVTRPLEGFASLLSVDKARESLGFVAEHRWRDEYRPA
jgi:nucleoside-diphosphate-sugar epimerase